MTSMQQQQGPGPTALIRRDPRDPDVRDDGLCVGCGKSRGDPGREPHRATAQVDPFCSSACARAWYGVSLPSANYTTGLGGSMGERR